MSKNKKSLESCVKSLIRKAEATHDTADAMRLTQAALNAANATMTLAALKNS